MQRLRKTADIVQRGLGNFADFAQFGPERRTFRRLIARPAQHRAHGSEDLSELIVKFPGNVTQGGFLRRNQLLSQLAALFRERGELREQMTVGTNEIKTGEHNRDQRGAEK